MLKKSAKGSQETTARCSASSMFTSLLVLFMFFLYFSNILTPQRTHPCILANFNHSAIQTFTKISPVRAKLFHVDKRVHLRKGSS